MNAARKYDILENHSDYERSISRNNLERIEDDPFEIGFTVKGLTSMNHHRNLSNYAEELVSHYAKYNSDSFTLFLSDLPEDEQNKLAALYMEATDRETGECVHGDDFSIDNDYTCALLKMLQDDNQQNRENFAEVTRKNIIIYYQQSLQSVLDEACNDYLHNLNNESGYYGHQDTESGELCWRRI